MCYPLAIVTHGTQEALAEVIIRKEIPKQVAEWFKDETTNTLEKRLAEELVELCLSQIDGSSKNSLIEKYGLAPVFKEYGLTE